MEKTEIAASHFSGKNGKATSHHKNRKVVINKKTKKKRKFKTGNIIDTEVQCWNKSI